MVEDIKQALKQLANRRVQGNPYRVFKGGWRGNNKEHARNMGIKYHGPKNIEKHGKYFSTSLKRES